MNITELLDAANAAHGTNDYRLAKLLEVRASAIANYRAGRAKPNDEIAQRLAELAGMDAGYVLASIHAERAADESTATLWRQIAARLRQGGSVAAGVILAAAIGGAGAPEARAMTRQAGEVSTSPSQLTPYTLARLARRARRALATLSGALSHGVTLGRAA